METKNIEEAFLAYLIMVGLNINQLPEVQVTEMRRSFYAGAGYMFRGMESVGEMTEAESAETFSSWENQIETFFELEVLKDV